MLRQKTYLLIFILSVYANADELRCGAGRPYGSIQAAIDDADNGDIVVAEPGTYLENIDFLGKAITVRSTDPCDPCVVAATIIDGGEPDDPNNASVVTFKSGEGNNSILTGFTIANGTGSWLVISWDLHEPYWNLCGGGIVCYNMSQPTISKNIIRNNTAGEGGGIYIYGDPVNISDPGNPPVHITPVISGNTFQDNSAIKSHGQLPPDDNYTFAEHGDGGAIVGFQGVDAIIVDNEIRNNHADAYGGGLHLRQWSDGLIQNNHIHHNDSALGAGVHITYRAAPLVTGNLIEENVAGNLGGGGIYIYFNSNPEIKYNHIRNNSSLNGSGIAIKFQSNPVVNNNLIDNNLLGAAISCTGSSPWIIHNTIINNSVVSGWSNYGGIECIGNTFARVENNIIAMTDSGYGIYAVDGAQPVIRYNNIWANDLGNYGPGVADMTGWEGNISVAPAIVCDAELCYRLNYTSPCINAGDPNYMLAVGKTDFDGDTRVIQARTDIGADEARPIWNVTSGKQFLSIQEAIDEADENDEIIVTTGRYYESISFGGVNITLRTVEPDNREVARQTIIDGNGEDSAVVTFTGMETPDCLLSGFTITGADHSGNGGGIAGNGSSATISNCVIIDNRADNGGGIYGFDGDVTNCRLANGNADVNGGAISVSNSRVINCIISDNHAGQFGGGLNQFGGDVINSTIVSNTAGVSGGGGNLCYGKISNSIIWQNEAPADSGLSNSVEPVYSCVQPGIAISDPNSITENPFFVDPDNDDYHLSIFSPCIDRANNNFLSQGTTDIDGEPRFFTLEPNAVAIADMGADEVVVAKADLNRDGKVDFYELMILTDEWTMFGEGLVADIEPDLVVNLQDFAHIADQWLASGKWYKDPEDALQFDSGTDGHVWIHTPDGCILNNVYTFTYTAWVCPLAFTQGNARIIGKNERAILMSYGGVLYGYANGFYTASSYSAVGVLRIGQWSFVAMTRSVDGDDFKVRLYVDGQEVQYQLQQTSSVPSHPHPDWRTEGEWDLHIGSEAWNSGQRVPDAVIDEVAIFDRVLTNDEISYLYNHGFGRPTPLWMGPIGFWHMDKSDTGKVIDGSGNGNDGVLSGVEPPIWQDGKL